MGAVARNPENFGTNAIAFVGKQTTFEDQVSKIVPANDTEKNAGTGFLRPELIELRPPLTLQPIRGFYPADRLKGNPSPDPRVAGMQMGGGMMNFFADPASLAFWLGELLMYSTDTSSIGYKLPALAAAIISGAGGTGTLSPTGSTVQPGNQIDKITSKKFTGTHSDGTTLSDIPIPAGLRAVRLKFAFTSAGGSRQITIVGTDQNDTPLIDKISATSVASSGTPELNSSRWFKTIKDVHITKGASGADGTLVITGDPETYFHRLKFTKEVNNGLTIEVHEGSQATPVTYAGAHIARGVLSIEPVVRALIEISANRAFPRQSIKGLSGKQVTVDDVSYYVGTSPLADTSGREPEMKIGSGTVAADAGYAKTQLYFKRRKPNFIPDWGMSWEVIAGDGVPDGLVGQHRLAKGNFVIDNLLGPPATRFAETTTYPKNVRKGNRDLMLAVQVDHTMKQDFDQFVGAEDFKSVFSAVSREFGKRYQAIRFLADNTQLISYPSRPILTLAEVLANLAIRMNIGESPGGNDEATVEIFNNSATL